MLLSLPPRYSIADLRSRFWYFVSDAATVPLSLLVLSFGVTNTSLRTLLISSVLGAQSDMCLTGRTNQSVMFCGGKIPLFQCLYVCVTTCAPCGRRSGVSNPPHQLACALCRACRLAFGVRLRVAEQGGSDDARARA